jgi:hypothetical protein
MNRAECIPLFCLLLCMLCMFLYARKNFGHIMLYPRASVRLCVSYVVPPGIRLSVRTTE